MDCTLWTQRGQAAIAMLSQSAVPRWSPPQATCWIYLRYFRVQLPGHVSKQPTGCLPPVGVFNPVVLYLLSKLTVGLSHSWDDHIEINFPALVEYDNVHKQFIYIDFYFDPSLVQNLLFLLKEVQQANVDDEEIARAINSKLGETPGISYSEIASKAVDCGRTHLAIKVS